MTLKDLIKKIDEFHSDTSRSPEETLKGLESAVEEIEPMIEGLKMTIACDE